MVFSLGINDVFVGFPRSSLLNYGLNNIIEVSRQQFIIQNTFLPVLIGFTFFVGVTKPTADNTDNKTALTDNPFNGLFAGSIFWNEIINPPHKNKIFEI